MHRYRSHTCGALREANIDQTARLSGWCHRIRDHGGLLFIDLRDHYGLTQVVADPDSPAFKDVEKLRAEWVVRFDGKVPSVLWGRFSWWLPFAVAVNLINLALFGLYGQVWRHASAQVGYSRARAAVIDAARGGRVACFPFQFRELGPPDTLETPPRIPVAPRPGGDP